MLLQDVHICFNVTLGKVLYFLRFISGTQTGFLDVAIELETL